jgi:hypothetical protein
MLIFGQGGTIRHLAQLMPAGAGVAVGVEQPGFGAAAYLVTALTAWRQPSDRLVL